MTLPKHPPTSQLFAEGSPTQIKQLLARLQLVSHKQPTLPSQKTQKGNCVCGLVAQMLWLRSGRATPTTADLASKHFPCFPKGSGMQFAEPLAPQDLWPTHATPLPSKIK